MFANRVFKIGILRPKSSDCILLWKLHIRWPSLENIWWNSEGKYHPYLLKCTSTRGTESTEVTKVGRYIHTQESVPCDFLYMMYRSRRSYSMLLDTALHRQWLRGSFLSACIFLFLNLRAYLQECVQFVKIQDAAFLRPTPVFGALSFSHTF